MVKRKRGSDGSGVTVNVGGSRGGRSYKPRSRRRYGRGAMERRMFPASKYFRQYWPRGEATAARFGSSHRSATAEQRAARTDARMFGAGAYSVGRNWRKFSQGLGLVPAARSFVSSGAAALGAGMMGGMGAYTNSLVNSGDMVADEVPQFASAMDETGAVCVTRREYVGEIVPTVSAFENHAFSINPGVGDSFRWLANIAQNFEEYDLKQCVFTFNSTVTDIGNSTNGQIGTVIMATQYNVASAPFADKATMAVHDGAMSCKASENMVHGVECDDAKRSGNDAHYIRTGAIAVGQDLHDYDHAVFNLATANIPAAALNNSIGELWVSYTVVLRKPRLVRSEDDLAGDLFVATARDAAATAFGLNADVLSGYGNTLGGALVAGATTLSYTVPDSYTGYLEFNLRYEHAVLPAGVTNPVSGVTAGSMTAVADMYAAGNDQADAPSHFWQTSTTTESAAGVRWSYVLHYFVPPGTSPALRTVVITLPSTQITSWSQAVFEAKEYFRPASTKTLAVGPLAMRTEEPVLVNRAGQVVDL